MGCLVNSSLDPIFWQFKSCYWFLILNAQTISFKKDQAHLTTNLMHNLQPPEDQILPPHPTLLQNSLQQVRGTIIRVNPIQNDLIVSNPARYKQHQNTVPRGTAIIQTDRDAGNLLQLSIDRQHHQASYLRESQERQIFCDPSLRHCLLDDLPTSARN